MADFVGWTFEWPTSIRLITWDFNQIFFWDYLASFFEEYFTNSVWILKRRLGISEIHLQFR